MNKLSKIATLAFLTPAVSIASSILPTTPILGTSSLAWASEKPVPQISVVGEASVNVAPDLAMIDLAVVREADTARQALSQNNEAMEKVIAALKESGIASKDLQTSGLSIQPKYQYYRPKQGQEQRPPKIVGYRVSNNLSVRIRDLAKVGEVLDKSVTLGVNSGGHIRFGNDDPSSHIAKARSKAMGDAIDKATTLLKAAGAKLGPIVTISEHSSQPRPVPMARGKMMAEAMDASAVPIEAGESSYSVNVSVSWEIIQ